VASNTASEEAAERQFPIQDAQRRAALAQVKADEARVEQARLFGETQAIHCERKVNFPVKPWEDAFIMRLKQGGMTFREISEALARQGSVRGVATISNRYYLLSGHCSQTLTEVAA
jgi:hypothetical protein